MFATICSTTVHTIRRPVHSELLDCQPRHRLRHGPRNEDRSQGKMAPDGVRHHRLATRLAHFFVREDRHHAADSCTRRQDEPQGHHKEHALAAVRPLHAGGARPQRAEALPHHEAEPDLRAVRRLPHGRPR